MANELKTTLELDIKPFLDAIKRAANNLRVLEDLRPKINVNEFQRAIQTSLNQIRNLQPEINVGLNVDTRDLNQVENQIDGIAQEPVRVDLLVNSEEIQTSLNRVRDLRQTAISIPPQTKLEVDTNADQVQSDIGNIKTDVAGLTSVDNVINFSIDAQKIEQQIKTIEDSIKRARALSEGQVLPMSLDFEPPTGEAEQKQALDELNKRKEQLNEPVQIKAEVDSEDADEKLKRVVETTKRLDNARPKINVQEKGGKETIFILNKVEKEANDIPKNVKINVDATGASGASKALSGVSGFAGQLGSGLLASFSGAAIGAAVANFASQAVRAIVSASDAADELNDKLKLAFTQAGANIEGFNLDQQLQNANVFALDLGENFGISINRSKELLAQVTGLTGEFGATSEAITKASIGIEEATGGLVKAETAAKLFSRSIGNPEDQAALETLAKRFPAIGEAIQSATDPAEKANAVISNLTGTFDALEEKAQGFGEQFQLLSEVAFGTFATALVPIADSFVPILESLRKTITENAGAIQDFGKRIVTGFVEPLVKQLISIGPQLSNFGSSLLELFEISGTISFTSLTLGIELLAGALDILSGLFQILKPLLSELANAFKTGLAPVIDGLRGNLDGVDKILGDVTFGLLGTKDATQGLNPLIETLNKTVSLLVPVAKTLGDNIQVLVVPAFATLKIAVEAVFLPLRVFNFLVEQGSKLTEGFSVDINGLAKTLSIASLVFPPFFQALNLLKNLSGQRIVDNSLGSQISNIGAQFTGLRKNIGSVITGFELLSVGVKKTPKIDLGGGGGGGKSKGTKSAEQELSALQKLIAEYDRFGKVIEERAKRDTAITEIAIKEEENRFGRRLTATEKFFRAQAPLEKQQERLNQLQKEFADILGTTPNKLAGIAEEYLKTGNAVASLPITIDTKDPQAVKDAEALVQRLLDLVAKELDLQTQQQELKIQIKEIDFNLDRQVISTQFENLQTDIQDRLDALRFGKITLFEFDAAGIKRALESIKQSADIALVPFDEKIKSTNKTITILREDLDKLKQSGQTNTKEFQLLQNKLRNTQDSLEVLTKSSEVYRNTLRGVTETQRTFGDTLQQTISDRAQKIATDLQRLTDAQDVQITIDLNAEGVNQGLIEIERNFLRSVNEIETFYQQAIDRLKTEQGGKLLEDQAEKLAESQKKGLRTLLAQREISIQQFKQQNDAVFAITQSLANNLGQALVPNTLDARRGLNERQKQIDSQLEVLRANLDAELQLNKDNLQLRTLSYQEYTEKVLELEKEKSDSIKQYEEEVSQARLQALQKIADDALPAIQNQLQLANAELTVLFQDSTANFEEVANKGLETIGLIAAQSLALAIQQAKSLEDVQRLFLRNVVSGLLKVLRVQLEAAIIGALLTEVQQKSFAGLITGAIISGVLVGLFAAAEAKILSSIGGFESGGYTGNGGTKEVAGVVHGQEFVVNARGTKGNRELLEWLNKGKSADSFFDRKPSEFKLNNFVDTKALNASINGLAYTMDARLSSMERTLDSAITKNASTVRTANQVDVSVYSDPGTSIKYMKKMGKIKGLT